jgi:lipopolysaccharide/colanic/teichoic acid biosynthesis glycosyltransferase
MQKSVAIHGTAIVGTGDTQLLLVDPKAKLKRAEDLVVASVLLVSTFPVMLLSALSIKLDTRGPILFSQLRHGRDGQIIRIMKFRSMYFEASDELCERQSVRNDPRITRVGAFLRRHSLDELPQLLNVIRGDMSLVGPRPHALAMSVEGHPVEDVVPFYRERYSIKPGITGWAQINGSRGQLDTIEKAAERVELDLYYVRNWSLKLDLKILFRTVFCIFKDDEAY